MHKLMAAILAAAILISCSGKSGSPDNPTHLEKEQMADVLTDLALMEAAVNLHISKDPTHPIDSNFRFNIYEQHDITKEQYQSSLNYYSERPKELKEIYDLVLNKLNQLKAGGS